MRKTKSPRKKLKDKLEKIVKEIVRLRDNRTCQYCGKENLEGANCHVSHVIPRSQSLLLQYDLINLKVLDFRHHLQWWHLNPVEAGIWFKDKFPERWAYLEEKIMLPKRSIKDYELEEKLVELKTILLGMEKEV